MRNGKDLWEFTKAVGEHSGSIVGSGWVALASFVWSIISAIWFGITAQETVVSYIVTIGLVLLAAFRAWREERDKRFAVELQLKASKQRYEDEGPLIALSDEGANVERVDVSAFLICAVVQNIGKRAAEVTRLNCYIDNADQTLPPADLGDHAPANTLGPTQKATVRLRFPDDRIGFTVFFVMRIEYRDQALDAPKSPETLFMKWGHMVMSQESGGNQVLKRMSHITRNEAETVRARLVAHGLTGNWKD